MRTHARRGALLGCVLFVCGPVAGASASTFTVRIDRSGTYVTYEAAAGEKNDVVVQPTNRGRVAIIDNGVAAISPPSDPNALSHCVPIANRVSCEGGSSVYVILELGDGDDRAQAGIPTTAYGGPGADQGGGDGMLFDGGPGPDQVIGFTGASFYYTEPGDLHLTLDGVADDGHAGEGDNLRPGDPVLINADGNDTIIGSQVSDRITRYGGQGTTHIVGGGGFDQLSGGRGDDTIEGGDQRDTLYGGEGNDTLDGGPDVDTLNGANGDDVLIGGPGRDTLDGYQGDDTLDIRDGESDGLADCGFGTDTLLSDPIDTAWLDCEAVNP
jgi:Ca2+-binding RTX toxin-like protein